ncbi:hypothetical protein Tco_1068453 [Tanacetum coccineum]|uniref:Uncharacterized protein n=1 Tax=Tanacetum coccineum TaxID=301880 RepID=A0ABQ5HFZ0_9ASTR
MSHQPITYHEISRVDLAPSGVGYPLPAHTYQLTKKAKEFKKHASPKLTTVPASPKEPTKKSKRVKRHAKKSTNAPIVGVVIEDTPGVSISKKKAPAKADRGKGIKLLSDASLLEDAQLKKALMKSRQETHKFQVNGSSEGANFESEVPDESKAKSSNTSEGTGVKPGVPDVSKAYSSESDNKSGGDSDDDNESDDNDDEGSENDDDSETDDENKEFDDEEYDDLYKDVNVRSKVTEHKEVRKGDVEMSDATRESGSKHSSFVSSKFASKFLILDNVPPVVDEVASMMNFKVRQEESSTQAPSLLLVPIMAIPKTSTIPATTVPPIIQPFTSILQQSPPTLEPTTEPSTTLIPALPDFSSLFGFDHRVSNLEKELS